MKSISILSIANFCQAYVTYTIKKLQASKSELQLQEKPGSFQISVTNYQALHYNATELIHSDLGSEQSVIEMM
jgi:hypothetical protein